jgi:hypothetical protein
MDVDDLELAAEFCKLVGAPNLLAYLGLEEGAWPDDARAKLKARRKFMQGMQGNPKYKREALFLIKHFTDLNDVLADVPSYLADARRRAESEHLPVIEMTIRGVLGSGSVPTDDQYAYLRRNALELGVTETSFREILARVAAESKVTLPGRMLGQATPVEPERISESPADLYHLLGIAPTATEDDIRIAYHKKLEELEELDTIEQESLRKKYEIARKVLSNEAARRHYDVNTGRTGPPARAREVRPPGGSATAPPVAPRTDGPGRPPRLEILGDPVRPIRVGSAREIQIRNGGDGPLIGAARSEVPWLVVEPTRLDVGAQPQTLQVRVEPKNLPANATTPPSGTVVLTTERGERATVVFELQTGPPLAVLAAVAALLVLVAVVGAAVLSMLL